MKKIGVTPTRYLLIESGLFLLFSYLLIAGGINTTNVAGQTSLVNLALVTLGGAAWFAWHLLRRRPFPSTFLDLPIFVLLLVTAATSLTSSDPRRSVIILWQLLLYALVFYLLVDLLRSSLPSDLLEKVLLLSSLPVIIYGILEILGYYASWFGMTNCVAGISLPSYRVYSTLYSPNILAGYLNLVLPLGIMRSIRSSRWTRLAWMAWCLVVLALDFFTSSRGGWLGTAVVLGVIALYVGYRWWQNRKNPSIRHENEPENQGRNALQDSYSESQKDSQPPGKKYFLSTRARRLVLIITGLVALLVVVAGGIFLITWELNNATHAGSGTQCKLA